MAQVIRFLPKQGLAGGGSTIYSEVFDATDFAQVVAELRVYSLSGNPIISGVIQDCMDPAMNDSAWTDVASGTLTSIAGTTISAANLKRFVRGKVIIPTTATGLIVGFEGVGRSST